jgi:hypothetical protein
MNHPGVWIMGDLADDDLGTAWVSSSNTQMPEQAETVQVGLHDIRQPNVTPSSADETFEITVVKHNGALNDFNQWLLNGESVLDGSDETSLLST